MFSTAKIGSPAVTRPTIGTLTISLRTTSRSLMSSIALGFVDPCRCTPFSSSFPDAHAPSSSNLGRRRGRSLSPRGVPFGQHFPLDVAENLSLARGQLVQVRHSFPHGLCPIITHMFGRFKQEFGLLTATFFTTMC